MKNTTMDRSAERQARINGHRAEASARYPVLWSNMIAEWNSLGPDDRAWLMYSANYLFRTNNIRWAMDPVRLIHRLPLAPDVNAAQDLEALSFVLLTHQHADHLDLDLIHALRHLPIVWVTPEPVLTLIQNQVDLPQKNVIVPKELERVEIQGIKITPFTGLHWEKLEHQGSENANSIRGVPATGYLVEFRDKRWLFPGDTRTYDANQLPSLGPVDGLFAHLWLGRGCAMLDAPPLLDPFCRFFADLGPRRIILTHLMEFGRTMEDYWDISHARMVYSCYKKNYKHIKMLHALLGQRVPL
jgi:L-ascorbate metabolism protein UlaG (beta-lactamase superfamily)